MERTPLDVISVLGAMYVLTVTVWAICIPSIQEQASVRKKLSLLYWIVALAIPAWRILEGLAAGRHLEEREPSNLFQDAQAIFLFVFVGFAYMLFAVLNDLSKREVVVEPSDADNSKENDSETP
ncbi:MAG: hypothetical protein AAGJ68_08805 [Pseudomonadota bacterium]